MQRLLHSRIYQAWPGEERERERAFEQHTKIEISPTKHSAKKLDKLTLCPTICAHTLEIVFERK